MGEAVFPDSSKGAGGRTWGGVHTGPSSRSSQLFRLAYTEVSRFFYAIILSMNWMDETQTLTVAQYLDLINAHLGALPTDRIEIVGEVIEYRMSQGKWVNFDLKDEEQEAKVSCFMTAFQLRVPLESGMKVKVIGTPKVYPRFGKFSLNVQRVELVGEGALAKAYEALKKRLATEGLFDEGRKRALPKFPERIALITSPDAAAYGDFLRILNNRWGGVEVLHIPVAVQGKDAVESIVGAFNQLNAMEEDRPELVVLTRGGGSLEDLHAFNDELTARAVFQSKIPVVVGVGHERDESLCDFVADVRASTPSNAAERIVPDRSDILREIEIHERRMHDQLIAHVQWKERVIERTNAVLIRFFTERMQSAKLTLERFQFAFERFTVQIGQQQSALERSIKTIQNSMGELVSKRKVGLQSQLRLLKTYDIQHSLNRGFSILRDQSGSIVSSSKKLKPGQSIHIRLSDGTVQSSVTDITST